MLEDVSENPVYIDVIINKDEIKKSKEINMANELDKVSLLVSSCDLYEDAWNPFFQLIYRNWPQHPNNIFLLSEEKTFNCDYMNIETINTKKGTPWTERLRFALDKIDTEYVLFSLEDYFVHAYVNNEAFIDAVKQLDAHIRWGGGMVSSN